MLDKALYFLLQLDGFIDLEMNGFHLAGQDVHVEHETCAGDVDLDQEIRGVLFNQLDAIELAVKNLFLVVLLQGLIKTDGIGLNFQKIVLGGHLFPHLVHIHDQALELLTLLDALIVLH